MISQLAGAIRKPAQRRVAPAKESGSVAVAGVAGQKEDPAPVLLGDPARRTLLHLDVDGALVLVSHHAASSSWSPASSASSSSFSSCQEMNFSSSACTPSGKVMPSSARRLT